MKLEDWVRGKQLFNCIRSHWNKVMAESKNLHVIGTCGECKYFEAPNCNRKIVWLEGANIIGFIGMPPKDFGCIDFKQKEAE